MSSSAQRGGSLIALTAALVLFPLGIGAAWYALRAPASGLPNTNLRATLLRSGLGAEALAASGVSAQETSAVVAAFASAMASKPGALEQADSAYADARVNKETLEIKVSSGIGTPQDVAALASAKATLVSAETARQDLLAEFFEDGVASLSAAKVATLTMLRTNDEWVLPVEFRVKERNQAEWVAIRDALNNERIAPQYGDPPDQAQQAALTTWRSDAPVAAAKAALTTNLASVQSAWDAATGG
jgi:hypothetical protein